MSEITIPATEEILDESQPKQGWEGQYTALVCVDDPKLLNRVLNELDGVKFAAPFSVDDAINRLKASTYDLIVLSETFRAPSIHDNRLLQEVNLLTEDRRREEFLVVIGPATPSEDTLTAFACSADAVLNTNDLSRLATVFHEGRIKKKNLYRRYIEAGHKSFAALGTQ